MNVTKGLYLQAIMVLFFACGQPNKVDIGEFKNIAASERKIQVTGSADMTVIPDEIEFLIEIEEYYEEEFQDDKKQKDYKTKVRIEKIEDELLNNLKSIGIVKNKIMVRNVGNYWRYQAKEIAVSKRFSIQLTNLDKIDEIISTVNMRGIDHMSIGKLNHSKIHEYRKQVKTEALKAASEKAEYLLSSLGKEVGDIISIREVANNNSWGNYWWSSPNELLTSNTTMNSGQNNEGVSPRVIQLRYEIETTFEIK